MHSSRGRQKDSRGQSWLVSLAGLLAVTIADGALSGCAATMAVQSGLGPPHTGMPEEVLGYDWAGRRGDEVVVAYMVRVDRAEEPRWLVIDLRQFVRTPPGAAPVAVLRRASLARAVRARAHHYGRSCHSSALEPTFATVRLRQRVTKGAGSRTKGLLMAYKCLAMAQVRWRRLDGARRLPLVRADSPRETRIADRWWVGRTVPSIILSPA